MNNLDNFKQFVKNNPTFANYVKDDDYLILEKEFNIFNLTFYEGKIFFVV